MVWIFFNGKVKVGVIIQSPMEDKESEVSSRTKTETAIRCMLFTTAHAADKLTMWAKLHSICKNASVNTKTSLWARLHEPGLALNPDQVTSPGPPFSSQTLVQLQAFDRKRVDPGWRPDPGLAANPGSCKRALNSPNLPDISVQTPITRAFTWKVITPTHSWTLRRILEALLIAKLRPDLKKQVQAFCLSLFPSGIT